ncbi:MULTISPECIES: tRNA lysidine(34) synthetase TilS [unclassified Pseudodesulfovibrio]|uniref:tRNA lysidine(34) synthetase TilS n=1 Tax=unclassified Pseudodesulfovibrio TaxID=2661612 RepID=UPI000FEB7607|nr:MULTISPECIES: tRNA lysidine(34) synthetase TilS [unclassified Pseudodesulfovibrio]MCJ2163862.1 tRNA lysidine(34) synthetase TilS [Pseudodesulfovibrio sp. S3-i]RWU05892.1 tRNA lysidine(34) synthetase TilS [Pseudodesulfovibrio sp. S3]
MNSTPCNIPQSLQDLLPKWAHFCLYVEKFITEELGIDLSGKRILVGLSGGVDSTALLCVLHYLSQRAGFHVLATHLNHGLRPEATQDAIWVKSLCDTLGVECHVAAQDVSRLAQKQAVGIEEAGRNARYALYADVCMENGADYVALGHQLDDLSEDVLMRLIRGTGWPGLSGMAGYDPDRALVRPLLMIPKSTLIAFVTHLGIVWREDHTNTDLNMTRNRVRNEILPLIQRENPNFWQSVARLWKIGRIETDYWDVATADTTECLENDRLQKLHKACRLRLYKACLDTFGPGQVLAETLFKLDEAWQDKRVGTVFQFPGDKTASVTASGVLFKGTH